MPAGQHPRPETVQPRQVCGKRRLKPDDQQGVLDKPLELVGPVGLDPRWRVLFLLDNLDGR